MVIGGSKAGKKKAEFKGEEGRREKRRKNQKYRKAWKGGRRRKMKGARGEKGEEGDVEERRRRGRESGKELDWVRKSLVVLSSGNKSNYFLIYCLPSLCFAHPPTLYF